MAIEVREVRIDTTDLALGMFVCRLDRPWRGTPFPLEGVQIRTADDIRQLRELCRYVYIDELRESTEARRRLLTLEPGENVPVRYRRATTYADTVPVQEELPRARDALRSASELLDRIYADIVDGRDLSVEHVRQLVRPLVASVLRSADAFLFLESMRQHDDYTYGHAISCGALAAVFGRQLGLPEETIIGLATGGMLMDVGKTRVSGQLLQRADPLTADEIDILRGHVEHGLAIARSGGIDNPDVIDAIATHHERWDGSGYPNRLAGDAIPMAGRMLAIVDSFDAMCRVRPHRAAVSRHDALQKIYRARNRLYQGELVEQFMVCMAVYPTGSRVELSNGALAVVLEQNQIRRLRPVVLVISDAEKRPLPQFKTLDLLLQANTGKPVDIVRALPIDACAIDTSGFLATG